MIFKMMTCLRQHAGLWDDYSPQKQTKFIYFDPWVPQLYLVCHNTSKLPIDVWHRADFVMYYYMYEGWEGIICWIRSHRIHKKPSSSSNIYSRSGRALRLTVATTGEAIARAANVVITFILALILAREVLDAHPWISAAQVAAMGTPSLNAWIFARNKLGR